jgi:hypothetical protein
MWAVASEADRVIVTTHLVATNPSRHRTKSLPFQNESSSSSIAIEPCKWGAPAGDDAVHRQRPEERQQHDEHGRDGGKNPGRGEGDAEDVAERGEVVDPGGAHDLLPGMLVGCALPRPRPGACSMRCLSSQRVGRLPEGADGAGDLAMGSRSHPTRARV